VTKSFFSGSKFCSLRFPLSPGERHSQPVQITSRRNAASATRKQGSALCWARMSSTALINDIDLRMPTTRKLVPQNNDTSPSRQAKWSKRLCTQNNGDDEILPRGGVDFGNFKGDTIYRNRISPCEKREDAHYSIEELVLPQTTMALCTTFEGGSRSVKWYRQTFRGIPELLVVTSAEKDTPHTIGAAALEPMTLRKENETEDELEMPGWYWLKCRPHTGGCLHSKVLVFRSRKGLRVVVSGNNLTRSQVSQLVLTPIVFGFGCSAHPLS
jgi:hypothetical protein